MLRSIDELMGYSIHVEDEKIGHVADIYFDDHDWVVRYLVVDIGIWLLDRNVLIAPEAIQDVQWDGQRINLALTKEQVSGSPDIDTQKPVSRQQEIHLRRYYEWPPYWNMPMRGPTPTMVPPPVRPPEHEIVEVEKGGQEGGDPNLRRWREVKGYSIDGADGDLGVVDDLIAEDESWLIRYLVLDTHRWLPGKKVLIVPAWIRAFDYDEKLARVDLKKETIRNSPEYDPHTPVNRKEEEVFYDYHGRPYYWD